MGTRKLLPAIAAGWALLGVAIGIMASGFTTGPVAFRVATFAGPVLALAAARAARLDRVRLFGALLLVSAIVTPTYFFLVGATIPFGIGLSNLVLGGLTPSRRLRWEIEPVATA